MVWDRLLTINNYNASDWETVDAFSLAIKWLTEDPDTKKILRKELLKTLQGKRPLESTDNKAEIEDLYKALVYAIHIMQSQHRLISAEQLKQVDVKRDKLQTQAHHIHQIVKIGNNLKLHLEENLKLSKSFFETYELFLQEFEQISMEYWFFLKEFTAQA